MNSDSGTAADFTEEQAYVADGVHGAEAPALTLMRLKPVASAGVVFKPFSASDDFTDGWWDDFLYGYSSVDEVDEQFYAVFNGQDEVARIEVEIEDALGEEYPAPSVPGPYAVIHFFEVSEEHRRRGYGTQVIRLIEQHYEGMPLVAFSEDADDFWGSLGWERHEHKTDPASRARYVSPGKTGQTR